MELTVFTFPALLPRTSRRLVVPNTFFFFFFFGTCLCWLCAMLWICWGLGCNFCLIRVVLLDLWLILGDAVITRVFCVWNGMSVGKSRSGNLVCRFLNRGMSSLDFERGLLIWIAFVWKVLVHRMKLLVT